MNNYESLDFYELDSSLSEEELLTRSSVRDLMDSKVIPLLRDCHREERFPVELIKEFGAFGLFGANLEGYGCSGIKDVAYGLMMQELERADSGIRSFISVQSALVMWPIYVYGSKEQKEKYLPRLATGESIGCFGLTEPDFGSDPGGMRTSAVKVPGGYRLNGAKMWITNGSIADLAVVWAKLDGKVRGFLVDRGLDGFKSILTKGKFSLRVSVTSELVLEDCVVPEENLLPDAIGLKAPLSCLTQARYGIAWGVLGAANQCYHTALEYAKDRKIFDAPMARFQLVQAKLAHMVQELTKGQLLVLQLGRLKEARRMKPYQVSLAKMNNTKIALEVARQARDMLGANGIIDEYPIIRHMLNLETVNTYEGTEDVHRLVIGAEVTGIPAFRS